MGCGGFHRTWPAEEQGTELRVKSVVVRTPGTLAGRPWAASGGWSGAPQIPPDFGQNWPWGSERECLDTGGRAMQSGPGRSHIRRADSGCGGQFLYLEFDMTLR